MKYTIEGFDQARLVDLGLDCVDAVLLRWFVDFYFSGKMKKIQVKTDGELLTEYAWINYQTCLDDLPLLRISNKEALSRRFKKMCKCGLMEKHISKNGGIYTYFKLVETEYVKLIECVKPTQKSVGIDSKVERVSTQKSKGIDSKVETKTLLLDPSTNNINSCSVKTERVTKLSEMFDQLYALYPRRVGKKAARKAYAARIRAGIAHADLEKAVTGYLRYIKDKDTEKEFVMHPSTFFGPNERWLDFVDYKTEKQQNEEMARAKESEKKRLAEERRIKIEQMEKDDLKKSVERGKAQMRKDGKTEEEIEAHYAWCKEEI